jgi:hypothetical protein
MMPQILKRIAIGVGLATLIVIAVGFMLPGSYTVTRKVTVKAAPAAIHALVGDLEQWPEWTPFLEADPTTVVTVGDKTTGAGASQSWTGESGSGELTFTRSEPDWGIAYDMVFDEGAYRSTCDMTYKVVDDGTEVSWSMAGDNGLNVLKRYMGMVMDKWVGPMFEDGLNKLKLVAETSAGEGT